MRNNDKKCGVGSRAIWESELAKRRGWKTVPVVGKVPTQDSCRIPITGQIDHQEGDAGGG